MRKFWQNYNTTQEKDGELENYSSKLRLNLAELECEEAIIEDKKKFGRVRKSMMNGLPRYHIHNKQEIIHIL